jgi:sphinganine C4-monooxygenase
MWIGGDVSVRYERSRLAAQNKADLDQSRVNESDPIFSEITMKTKIPNGDPSHDVKRVRSIPVGSQQPTLPTKVELQVAESRQQVLDETDGGGLDVLLDESREEKDTRRLLSRDRRKTTNSISGTDSFKGLRDRVAGSMHGRAGGIIGMESNR